jgi:hypothetical protein
MTCVYLIRVGFGAGVSLALPKKRFQGALETPDLGLKRVNEENPGSLQ